MALLRGAHRKRDRRGEGPFRGRLRTIYVAAFLKKMEAWESSARSNYASDCAGDWLDGVVEEHGYSVSERALKRVKNPKQPASNETAEDTAAAG